MEVARTTRTTAATTTTTTRAFEYVSLERKTPLELVYRTGKPVDSVEMIQGIPSSLKIPTDAHPQARTTPNRPVEYSDYRELERFGIDQEDVHIVQVHTSYQARNSFEVSCQAGEIVEVLNWKNVTDFWTVRCRGQQGKFPKSCLQLQKESDSQRPTSVQQATPDCCSHGQSNDSREGDTGNTESSSKSKKHSTERNPQLVTGNSKRRAFAFTRTVSCSPSLPTIRSASPPGSPEAQHPPTSGELGSGGQRIAAMTGPNPRDRAGQAHSSSMAAAVAAPPPVKPRPAHTMRPTYRSGEAVPFRHHSFSGCPPECQEHVGFAVQPASCTATAQGMRSHSTRCIKSISLPVGFELVQAPNNETRPAAAQQKSSKRSLFKAKSKLSRFFRNSDENSSKEEGPMAHRELPRTPDEDDAFVSSPVLGMPAPTTFVIPGQNTVVTAPLTMIRHPSQPAGDMAPSHSHVQRVSSWNGSKTMASSPNTVSSMGQHRPLQRCIDRRMHHQHLHMGTFQSPGQVAMFYPTDCRLITPEFESDFEQLSRANTQPVCFTNQYPVLRTSSLPADGNVRSHRPLQRLFSNESSNSVKQRSNSTFSDSSPYANSPGFDYNKKYRPFEWFYGQMTRERAEELLLKYGQDGDYLVRERDSQPGSYAISIRKNTKTVRHFRVYDDQHGFSCDSQCAHSCPSLIDLVLHHEKVPLTGKGNFSEVFYLDCSLDRSAIPASEGIPDVSSSTCSSLTDLSRKRSSVDDDSYFDPSATQAASPDHTEIPPITTQRPDSTDPTLGQRHSLKLRRKSFPMDSEQQKATESRHTTSETTSGTGTQDDKDDKDGTSPIHFTDLTEPVFL